VRAGRRAEETAVPEALHRLRVRVKRLRYALETLGALGDKATAKLLRRLARLQDVLGEHQDAVTEAAWLRRWAETPGLPPGTLLGLGALSDRLVLRARKRRLRFPAPWRRVERRRLRDAVLDELRGGARGRARMPRAVAS
jgi:CHAD domain-containing protein